MSPIKMCLWGTVGVYVSDKFWQTGMYLGFPENIFHVLVSMFPITGYLLSTVQIKHNSEVFQCLLFLILDLSHHEVYGSQVTPCTIAKTEGLAVFISSLM